MALPRPAPGTGRWWVVGILGVGAMVAFVVWIAVATVAGRPTPVVTGYAVQSDALVRLDYDVHRSGGEAVRCRVVALNEKFGRVGTVEDDVPAGEGSVHRTVDIRTSSRAVTAVVEECRASG